ncbi:lantibiotic dehydratase [Dyadobacter frigoris]|uniref:Lantibiotic dehydratase n=1 Tax=Dyadobacter frigoris TaxID=2576211 RepID=A0A4U6CQJ9_9BACT|nr:lantibiotic dehydratase [Dyadobacter frigoris]TKT85721.1 hypothetical protein FDK13_33340 [Dyadobacter frigoris]
MSGTKYQQALSYRDLEVFSQIIEAYLAHDEFDWIDHQSDLIMKPQNFFMLRRPLLSNDFFFSFQKAVGSDPQAFESYLKLIYLDPLLQNALHLASPGLHEQLQRLLNGKLQNGKEDLLQTLFKYLIRMSTRCTPFGLFAGYSLGAVTEKTIIRFDSENEWELHTKLDEQICFQLVGQIRKSPKVTGQLKLFPNSSLYQIMDSYRYIERGADGKTLGLSAIKSSLYLARLLEHAKDGRTVAELNEILWRYNVGKKIAKTFVNSLIDSQFFVSRFEMNATGENYLERIQKELNMMTGCEEYLEIISRIQILIQNTAAHSVIQQSIKTHLDMAGLSTPDKSFLQTDLAFRASTCEISRSTIDMMSSEISELAFLTSQTENTDLAAFASRLFSHFGDKPVPLLPVLDPASGVAYGTLQPAVSSNLTLLSGLTETTSKENSKLADNPISRLQKRILDKTKTSGRIAYELTGQDILAFENEKPTPLPESFYVFGSIICGAQSDFDKGEFSFDLKSVAGPSALNLMSRFGQSDPALKKQLENAARLEEVQNPDVIFAEICHVPSANVLKVINRPSLHSFEIPYLSESGLPSENQIQPCELLVSSPDGRQIILSCQRLDKRIIPRLTSAHYYANGLPFYRFLCELSQQADSASFGWDWGDFHKQPFSPRITYKHLVLQKATWRIEWDEFKTLNSKSEDLLSGWATFSQQKKIPRYFQIQQGDNELLIDGQNLFSLQILEDTLKKSSPLTLTEYLETECKGFLSDKGNTLANEVIIPFLNPRQQPEEKIPVNIQTTPAVFHLGSEWLYVKLYCSSEAADFLLSKIIEPFCDAMIRREEIEKWFFIRYYDPKPHLRVRFHVKESKMSWSTLLRAFQKTVQPYLENGLISAFTTDQYKRETERYKLLAYSKMELIFYVDSYLTCKSLRLLTENKEPDLRWLLALRGCDSLLNSAGLTTLEKFSLIKRLHQEFSLEFNASANDLVLLDQKYRTHKKIIISFLDPKKDSVHEINPFTAHFDELSNFMRRTFTDENVNSSEDLIETAAHLMHLFLNRWFNQMHRKQEWIIYHFLKKYYDMDLNLKKTAKNGSKLFFK